MGKYSRTYHVSVMPQATQLCSFNPDRKSLLVVNNGDETVYILSAQNLSSSDGIPVYSKGTYKDKVTQCELWIITDAATAQDVRVMVVSD
jgi:hypothetical protein